MLRRDFNKLVTAAVALHGARAWAEDQQTGIEEDDGDALVFNGVGVVEAPKRYNPIEPKAKPVSHPLWVMREGDVFKMDVATIQGYKTAQYALRDVQANRMGFPDPKLLIGLSRAQVALATLELHSRFDTTSGMRTTQTNNKTEGAALGSLHVPDKSGQFFATDFRARGFDAKFTAKLMGMVGLGGIGVYLVRDFVHVDTGRSRKWIGR